MNDQLSWLRAALALALVLGATASLDTRPATSADKRLDGLNVMAALGHPFGTDSSRDALADAKRVGARAIAVVPFLSQPAPASPDLSRKDDMTDAELHAAIHDAHALGLAVLVKPHVVLRSHWAGEVAMGSAEDWTAWFANYRRELLRIAGMTVRYSMMTPSRSASATACVRFCAPSFRTAV